MFLKLHYKNVFSIVHLTLGVSTVTGCCCDLSQCGLLEETLTFVLLPAFATGVPLPAGTPLPLGCAGVGLAIPRVVFVDCAGAGVVLAFPRGGGAPLPLAAAGVPLAAVGGALLATDWAGGGLDASSFLFSAATFSFHHFCPETNLNFNIYTKIKKLMRMPIFAVMQWNESAVLMKCSPFDKLNRVQCFCILGDCCTTAV